MDKNEEFYETVKSLSKRKTKKFPFKELKKGFSFIVKFDEISEASIRNAVNLANSKTEGSYFSCVKHIEHKIYEVANIGSKENKNKGTYPTVESSPQALAKDNLGGKTLYPFSELVEGKSFIVPFADANEKSLQTLCYVQGRKCDKKFVLIKHEESAIYEIACLKKTQPVFYGNSSAALAKGVS